MRLGQELPTEGAVYWLSGLTGLGETPDGLDATWLTWRDERGIVALYDHHAAMVEEVETVLAAGFHEGVTTDDGKVLMSTADLRRRAVEELRSVRAYMRERDLILPDLPEDLADIDQERPRKRRR